MLHWRGLVFGTKGVRGISPCKQILSGFRLRKSDQNFGFAYANPVLAKLAITENKKLLQS